MTGPLIVVGIALALVAATAAAAARGCHVVLHPPKMLPMEIWPDRYGLAYETVGFTADGLSLKGWLIPAARATERTVLLCHGWGDNKGDLLQHTYFLQRDFNLFFIDFRQHGESEGDRSTIGALETRDVEAALDFLATARPEWTRRLGAYGHSMGAALAVWAAARNPGVKAVVLEAPFASFNEVCTQWTANEFHLPYFPVVWGILAMIRWRLGMDPEPFSPIYHVERLEPRPTLFIAGEEDRLMPLAVVRRLYDKAREPKELWVVPGAAHGKCETVGGDAYRRKLGEFFRKHL